MNGGVGALKIDYYQLMCCVSIFAFKTFAEINPETLTSLLNAIFANSKINHIVKKEQKPPLNHKKCERGFLYIGRDISY